MKSNDETNNANEHNMVKNPNWREADQLAILQAWARSWTRVYRETTPAKWSEWDLNPQPLDFKSGTLTTRPRCLHEGCLKGRLIDGRYDHQ